MRRCISSGMCVRKGKHIQATLINVGFRDVCVCILAADVGVYEKKLVVHQLMLKTYSLDIYVGMENLLKVFIS